MNDRDKQNPGAGSESDISKSQSGQQPASGQQSDRATTGSEQTGDQAATGQAQSGQFDQGRSDQAGFGETATQQRSDVEGSSIGRQPTGEAESGFVGSEGGTDTSSELVEDEDEDFSKDGQGAPEGK